MLNLVLLIKFLIMKIKLGYGKTGLNVNIPDGLDVTVLEPQMTKGLPDEKKAIINSLRNPWGTESLRDLAKSHHTVGIVFNDITRATPYRVIMPALLSELDHLFDENIILFNATGTHRENTKEELISILGEDVYKRFKIIQNDCMDNASHVHVGTTTSGNRIEILSSFMQCDIKILTGFIEPHFFAGFSGGGKAIMPGLASLKTIMGNHNPNNVGNPQSTWGITEGNPLWEEVREAASFANPTFLLNVAMNKEKQVTAVFSGDFIKAHKQGCAYVKKASMVEVSQPFDIVITSNSGYPLDLNVYQAVKGMSAAYQAVKKGGAIIIAAECWDGIPDHGSFREILAGSNNPQELIDKIKTPGYHKQDMWQAQVMAEICRDVDVYLYSHLFNNEETLRQIMLKPCPDIEQILKELLNKHGKKARIGILPEGPQTIPFLKFKRS